MVIMMLSLPARGAGIVDLTAANTRDDLLLFLRVEEAFTEAIEKALLSGMPIHITFSIHLDRQRRLWFDERIVALTATHNVKYNPLKKEFVIERSWDGDFSFVTQSLDEVRRMMSDIGGMRVASMERIEKGQVYRIRVRAELSRVKMSPAMQQMLLVVPALEFKTDWRTVSFTD